MNHLEELAKLLKKRDGLVTEAVALDDLVYKENEFLIDVSHYGKGKYSMEQEDLKRQAIDVQLQINELLIGCFYNHANYQPNGKYYTPKESK